MKKLIRRLVELDESRNGKPSNRHELRFLLQWIHGECLLRGTVSKREIYETVVKIDGYQFLEVKDV